MMKIRYGMFLLAAFVLGGSASVTKYSEVASKISTAADDMGRIYVYRTVVLGAAVQPEVKLNGEVIGKAVPGGFFYVDRLPGDYEMMTSTEVDRSLAFTLDEGQTRYVRLNIGMGFFVGHVYPELVESEIGAKEIKECSYTGDQLATSEAAAQ